MNGLIHKRPGHLCIEYGFVVAIVAALFYAGWFFHQNGYLPQPFFYEPWGTFMDWYSLTAFAQFGGAYEVGGTIYPPLSFVVLRIFSFRSCYVNNGSEWARDCDWLGVVVLSCILVINIALTFKCLHKIDKKTFIPRGFALSLGLPMVFTYERGNLLLFCYTCVLLSFGPLLKSARLRWFFGGLAANFKIYLIGALVAPLLRRGWIRSEGMIIFALVIYLATFLLLGEGSPTQVFENLTAYSAGFGSTRLNDLWYPSSLIPAVTLLNGSSFPITSIMDSDLADMLLTIAVNLMKLTELLIVIGAFAAWLRPEVVSNSRVIFLAIAMAVSTSEAGGYTEMLLLLFVFMERWEGWARPAAITSAYILCVPVDYVQKKLAPVVQTSWLMGGASVYGEYGVGWLAIIRPLIAMLIIWCMVLFIIGQVWSDIQTQGWKTRWRFRGDFRIMLGSGSARPPKI